ncbi:MAG: hypothetical protein A2Z25_24695 [Planctomycetes bacterium RBG_16_55_9]|nr:MAG: hypothetical protein A2Z25_24695 [Planctomycetes bacterium RBG_16_55_9]
MPVVDGQSKIESLSRAKSRDRKSKIINLVGIRLKGQEILDQIAVFQTTGWRFHFAAALLTTVDTLVGGAATYLLAARMANIDAPVLVLVWLCAVIYIVGRLPITVANLGVREVTLVGFLAVYNVEKSAALLMSMILFSAQVAMAIVGALYQISWAIRGKKATSRRGETSQR